MSGTCKDCRHWALFHPKGTYGTCDKTLTRRGKPMNDTLAYASSDSGTTATLELVTKDLFGCNQFEAKA